MRSESQIIINYTRKKRMLTIDLHRSVLINILREIYSDSHLRAILGFKGGTAAVLFYALPRFSVDLDFDLLVPERKDEVLVRLKSALPKFGTLVAATEKRYTLFFLINYKKGERNLKVEISKRPSKSEFAPKNFLGISMLVMKDADMAAGKLAALLTRKRFATRDMYDLWFFLKNNWPINEKLVHEKTGKVTTSALKEAQKRVETIKKTELLSGLGELLGDKQKAWVREKLKDDLLFYLKLRLEMMGKTS